MLILKKKEDHESLKEKIKKAMEKISEYTSANKLALNQEKSTIMIVTKNKNLRENFEIELGGKKVKHTKNIRILGNYLSDDLTWDHHVRSQLLPALQNRARTLRIVGKYMDMKFKKIYAQAIFKSKILFGAETWGGGYQKS